jgi:K+-transporting ATPase c subunit
MTHSEQISAIANQLANQGKKPTVALVKAKLTSAVPLPAIIASLKSWQHDPDKIALTQIPSDAVTPPVSGLDPATQALISQALTLALAPIHQELADIKKQLKQLSADK